MFALRFPPRFLILRSALCGLKDIRQMAFYSHWSPGLRGSGNVTRTEEPLTAAEVSVLFSHPSLTAPTATKSTSTRVFRIGKHACLVFTFLGQTNKTVDSSVAV